MNLDALLGVDLSLDDQVAARFGDADQGAPFLAFAVEQRVRRCVAVLDIAFQDYGLAGPTGAVGAGVGQPDAFSQARVEHGLVVPASDLGAERFYTYGVCRRCSSSPVVCDRASPDPGAGSG